MWPKNKNDFRSDLIIFFHFLGREINIQGSMAHGPNIRNCNIPIVGILWVSIYESCIWCLYICIGVVAQTEYITESIAEYGGGECFLIQDLYGALGRIQYMLQGIPDPEAIVGSLGNRNRKRNGGSCPNMQFVLRRQIYSPSRQK